MIPSTKKILKNQYFLQLFPLKNPNIVCFVGKVDPVPP